MNNIQYKIERCMDIIKECEAEGYDNPEQEKNLHRNLQNYNDRLEGKMNEYLSGTYTEQEFAERTLETMKPYITGGKRYTPKGISINTIFGRIHHNFPSEHEQIGDKDWTKSLGANYNSWKINNKNKRIYQMIYCHENGLDIDSFEPYELQIRFKDGDYTNYAADNLIRA
jgi:hypothetical protein